MAHFVDGRRFLRISGQLLHVPMGAPIKVGLWGGRETSGHLLDVAVVDPGLVRVARSTPRGDLQMFLLTALRVGSTELRVVASNSTVWDTCSLHAHMPRRKQLPKWDDMSANYAGDEETSEDFRARIGGQVDNSQLTNTCTLRISEAFNQAGQAIPKHHPGLLTLKGADHHNYALRVAEFKSSCSAPMVLRT